MNPEQEIKRLRLELTAWKAEAKSLRETMCHITTLIDVNKRLVDMLDRVSAPNPLRKLGGIGTVAEKETFGIVP